MGLSRKDLSHRMTAGLPGKQRGATEHGIRFYETSPPLSPRRARIKGCVKREATYLCAEI